MRNDDWIGTENPSVRDFREWATQLREEATHRREEALQLRKQTIKNPPLIHNELEGGEANGTGALLYIENAIRYRKNMLEKLNQGVKLILFRANSAKCRRKILPLQPRPRSPGDSSHMRIVTDN